jgi:hypothetical protein
MKFVVTHPDQGILVGDYLGNSIWSLIDPNRRDTVMAFNSEGDARTLMSTFDDVGDIETWGYEYVPLDVPEHADCVTVDELKAAGLGHLLGHLDKAPRREGKLEPWELTFDEFTGLR